MTSEYVRHGCVTNDLNRGPLVPSPSSKLASLSLSFMLRVRKAETRIAENGWMKARRSSACSGDCVMTCRAVRIQGFPNEDPHC